MSTPNSENQTLINEETSPSSILPKTSLNIPMPIIGDNVGGDKNVNNFQGAKLGGGFAGRDYKGNVNYKYADASLNETVAKIETLINDFCQNSPVSSTTQQMTIATQVIATIEDNPDWKQKAIKACQQGLLEAIKTNPVGAFVVGAIASWKP